MDRNTIGVTTIDSISVALRKESVDRNETLVILTKQLNGSLSARRAWIEITERPLKSRSNIVALRKESVDRNLIGSIDRAVNIMSLSARRAWIEINMLCNAEKFLMCRSPQGERG